jgi:hypothetical protein
MTIHQLAKPCFVLDPSPYPDSDYGDPHYETWAEASEALAELRKDRGPDPLDLAELEPVKVKALPGPCWVAECGVCDEPFESDEGGNHYETTGDLEAALASYEWTTLPADGSFRLAYCPDDRPEGAVVPPLSPAELEAAGQLVLPGVLP